MLECSKYMAPTPLILQQVQGDGISLVGDPLGLLTNTQYDGPNTEAPSLIFHDGEVSPDIQGTLLGVTDIGSPLCGFALWYPRTVPKSVEAVAGVGPGD